MVNFVQKGNPSIPNPRYFCMYHAFAGAASYFENPVGQHQSMYQTLITSPRLMDLILTVHRTCCHFTCAGGLRKFPSDSLNAALKEERDTLDRIASNKCMLCLGGSGDQFQKHFELMKVKELPRRYLSRIKNIPFE